MKPLNPLFGAAVLLGSFVSVAEAQAPIIVAQPANKLVRLGSTASFSVAVSGTGPFAYQWQFNGTNLPYDGVISTVAGNGTNGYSGDGGAATSAELSNPGGVAVDASGNLFIADSGNYRIREVGTNGIITTVAGNGTNGYSGDGGPATQAELNVPIGPFLDAFGNLFILDLHNNVIRKVGTDGIITTVAGNGTVGYSGDGGPATKAELYWPNGVAVDASGNLFIADTDNNVIREVGTNGIITTVAGNGYTNSYGGGGYSGDGGPATQAELYWPSGVAVDAFGNLFIADTGNRRIREVGTDGIISTVAGNGTLGYSGDGGPATKAEWYWPHGVAVDASGNLFIVDVINQRIRGVVFPGPTLVLTNVRGAYAGSYDVVVSSPYGSVTSSVVTLVVALNPLNVLGAGGQEVQLQFQGVPGNSYVLLSATDLTPPIDWRPVSTNAAGPSGQWAFTVTNALSSQARFYRMSSTGQ